MTDLNQEVTGEAPKTTRQKRFEKSYPEGEKTILESEPSVCVKEVSTGQETVYHVADLPANVQAKLATFGLGHKIVDSVSGKSGEEAINAMAKIWEQLKAGNWKAYVPKETISKKSIVDKLANMSPEDREAAKTQLRNLGISI
jgi:hypothetical protein